MSFTQQVANVRNRVSFRLFKLVDELLGSNAYRYATVRCSTFPSVSSVDAGRLYITQVGRLCKWVSFRCPGLCGRVIRLRLSTSESPHWRLKTDWLGRTSVIPSVRQETECGCHFWVRKGRIEWCADSLSFMEPVNLSASINTVEEHQ